METCVLAFASKYESMARSSGADGVRDSTQNLANGRLVGGPKWACRAVPRMLLPGEKRILQATSLARHWEKRILPETPLHASPRRACCPSRQQLTPSPLAVAPQAAESADEAAQRGTVTWHGW